MTANEESQRRGHLVIIGGGEDRRHDMKVLSRFVELCGGAEAHVVVVTAASAVHDEMWEMYDRAFGELGVRERSCLTIQSRGDANDAALAERVLAADGVFMTGGDQKRLLARIGGTAIDDAMHRAFKERGACIGGTSAGASAMSEHMLAVGRHDTLPGKGTAHLAAGLGFLSRVVIDQHFSERQRLARLLSIVAQNPYLVGVGIDEDTALVIERDGRLEVVGEGAVTLLDGRQMTSNYLDVDEHEHLELINVRLHLLPAGASYRVPAEGQPAAADSPPDALREILSLVMQM